MAGDTGPFVFSLPSCTLVHSTLGKMKAFQVLQASAKEKLKLEEDEWEMEKRQYFTGDPAGASDSLSFINSYAPIQTFLFMYETVNNTWIPLDSLEFPL